MMEFKTIVYIISRIIYTIVLNRTLIIIFEAKERNMIKNEIRDEAKS